MELTDPATLTNTEPENVPERAGSGHIRDPVPGGISATFEAEYTGTQFCIDPDSGEDVRLDGGSWLNATVSKVWPWSGGSGPLRNIETSILASNLTDTALDDACGLPQPGDSGKEAISQSHGATVIVPITMPAGPSADTENTR